MPNGCNLKPEIKELYNKRAPKVLYCERAKENGAPGTEKVEEKTERTKQPRDLSPDGSRVNTKKRKRDICKRGITRVG